MSIVSFFFTSFSEYYLIHVFPFFEKATALLGGTIYYQLANNGSCTFNQRNSTNVSIALFYCVTVVTLINVLAATLAFPIELPIYFHEVIIF